MITLANPTFETLDALAADVLVIFISSDRLPLRGAAGLADWRLCGAISRSLLDSGFQGVVGERLIMPTHGRIAPACLMLIGAGRPSSNINSEALAGALDGARRAGFKRLAVELPGNIDPQVAADVLARLPNVELTVLGPDEQLRAKLEAGGSAGAQPRERAATQRRR